MHNFTRSIYFSVILSFLFINSNAYGQSDACITAAIITNGVTAFSTAGFSGSNESSCGGTGDTNDGWFLYTATCTGDVTVSTCGDADFDTTLAAFDGCGGAELTCNDDDFSCSGNTSTMTFAVTFGNQYWIRIAGYNGATGSGNITISCGNDDCDSALTVGDGTTAFSTAGFSGTDESSCAFNDFRDSWYVYTATCTGEVTVTTCDDADFDTVLAAFASCGGAELACNDDDPTCGGNTSTMTFDAVSGDQYWIRIAGYNGASGTGNITISCASDNNDACADAFDIDDGVTAFTTVGFTGSDETSCTFNDTNDAWYIYTATCTGDVTVTTCDDANFDTSLAAFDGCGGTELACDDDDPSCSGNTSTITFSTIAGNQYWIRVAGYNGATGTGDITISCVVPAPENDLCGDAISVGNPSSTAGTTVNATTTEAPPTCITTVTSGGVWYSYTSTATEEVTISLCGAPYDSKIGVYTGSCGSFNCVIGEDDDFVVCGDNDPSVTFVSTANFAPVTYYIYVHGYQSGQGTFTMNLQAILPVELALFEGEAMKDYNMLRWETTSEANTEMHVIERSTDGREDWKMIGQLAAAGNSSETVRYSLKDEQPIPSAYYRLKSVDFGGYTEYSDLILLERETKEIEVFRIAPNPASTWLDVDFYTPGSDDYTIRIMDMVGQTMYQEQHSLNRGNHRQNVDVSALPSGVYLLSISNGSSAILQRIVKQ